MVAVRSRKLASAAECTNENAALRDIYFRLGFEIMRIRFPEFAGPDLASDGAAGWGGDPCARESPATSRDASAKLERRLLVPDRVNSDSMKAHISLQTCDTKS